jgi:hypothetical protein
MSEALVSIGSYFLRPRQDSNLKPPRPTVGVLYSIELRIK